MHAPFRHTGETSPLGYKTDYSFDNVTQVTLPSGKTVVCSPYTPFGQAGKTRDPRGNYTLDRYDSQGKLLQSVVLKNGFGATADPATNTPTAGELLAQTIQTCDNATGNLRRVKRVKDFASQSGPSVTYEHDSGQVHLVSISRRSDVNGDGVTTRRSPTMVYDPVGRPTMTDAGGRWRSTVYDDNGNAVVVTDSAGRSTLTTYDELDRPVRVVGPAYDDITHGRIRPVTIATWDALGNLVRLDAGRTDAGGTTPGNDLVSLQQEFTYDDFGRKIKETDAAGKFWRYRYDAVGRLTTIWDSQDSYLAFVYDQGARLKQKWLANGITTEYAHNADNSVAQIRNRVYDFSTRDYQTLTQHDLAYDALGRRRTASERVGPFTAPAQTVAYGYDPLGNRIRQTDGGTVTAYLHDATQQLNAIRSGGPAGALVGALVYDNAGNRVRKCQGGGVSGGAATCSGSQILDLAYDANQRLVAAAGNGVSETYGYDDQGRRIRKTSNGVTTWYLYNGPDIVAEYEGDWQQPTAFTTHGPNTDDPIVRYTRNATGGYDKRYYHQDAQNSAVAVTDGNGALVGAQLFDAWGNAVPGAPLGRIERYGYTGREPDASGLIYYRARYYDPTLARFTQRDPSGLAGGLNPYAYVGNDPVNYIDPSGLVRASPVSTSNETAYGGGDCRLSANGYGDDSDGDGTLSDADGSEGVDTAQGAVRLAGGGILGVCGVAAIGFVSAAIIADSSRPREMSIPAYQGMPASGPIREEYPVEDGIPAGTPPTTADRLRGSIASIPGRVIEAFGNLIHQASPKPPKELEPITNPPQAPVIPEGWVSRPGRVSGSEIYYPPGGDPNNDRIRVMPPGSSAVPELSQNGYWELVRGRQARDPSTGKPGTKGQTHVPLPPNSTPPTRRP